MKNFLLCLLSYCCGMPFFASGQAIRTALALPATSVKIRITNDSLRKNYTNITLAWQVIANGLVTRKGMIPGLTLVPGHPRMLALPVPAPARGEEAFIKVEYRAAARGPLAARARIQPPSMPALATQTLPLTRWGGDIRIPATGELSFADSNNVFTVSSPDLRLSFDKESGWIQQYTVNGQSLFRDSDGLRPVLPSPPHLQLFSTSTGSQMAIVRTEYTVPELSCLLHLSYTINSNGALLVESTLETDTTRQDSTIHSVPSFGIHFLLPRGSYAIDWYGLTEPPADSIPSIHHAPMGPGATEDPAAAFVARWVRWLDVRASGSRGFRITADSNFLQTISGDPVVPNLDLYNSTGTSPTPYPIHRHLSFRLTSLPILSRPTAKPI